MQTAPDGAGAEPVESADPLLEKALQMAATIALDPAYGHHAVRAPVAMLAADEESALVRQWKEAKDEEALHALVLAHAPLVAKWARHYRAFGVAVEDLVQEGQLGLLRAAERFDPEFGIRFSGYAGFWVRSAIRKHVLGNRSMVARTRVGRVVQNPDGTRRPTWPQADVSLNQPASESGEERERLIADDSPNPEDSIFALFNNRQRERLIREAMETLSAREIQILRARWLTERRTPLAELGREMGLTGERVRQLERRALSKLASALRDRVERAADLYDED
jgi:RNA polymerase sigma-32 factor